MNLVEIWDVDRSGKDKYIGLFHIMPINSSLSDGASSVTYEIEHVLATLLEDTMIGWHEIGNTGVYTANVLSYILSKQLTKRWVLGRCDYSHQYLYGWQDENLLSALYSVTNAFEEDDYRWEFNTLRFPWTLNLIKVTTDAVTDIRYKKNINGIQKTIDPTNLTTRLYCYGFGDGDNRLTFSNLNGGKPYLDSPNIGKYGTIVRIWTDERFTQEQSLLDSARSMLQTLEEPIVSYTVDIATIRKTTDLEAGDMVRVVDDASDIYTRVIEVSKNDVSGAPLVGKVVLANKTTDIAQSVADMADRQRIATTYSQGAESLFADSLYDNCDNANPAELSFTVPQNAIHVNEILFSARLTNFRAYSKATQGGGANTLSSNSGGGFYNSSDGGGGANPTSASGGGTSTSTSNGGNGQATSTYFDISANTQLEWPNSSNQSAAHNHGISQGTHFVTNISVTKNAQGLVTGVSEWGTTWVPSGVHSHGSHSHTVNIPSHSHAFTVPSHTHSIQIPTHYHMINIPTHQHNLTLPNHTHAIEYGIYKGPVANQMTVYIDNTLIGTYVGRVDNVNLISYMQKNANGNVLRGLHTIKIVPNVLTRVECSIQVRLFTNSHGAGQY